MNIENRKIFKTIFYAEIEPFDADVELRYQNVRLFRTIRVLGGR